MFSDQKSELLFLTSDLVLTFDDSCPCLGVTRSSSVPIKVGDSVRVRPDIETPKYKWGSVTTRSVGVVRCESLCLKLCVCVCVCVCVRACVRKC